MKRQRQEGRQQKRCEQTRKGKVVAGKGQGSTDCDADGGSNMKEVLLCPCSV